MGHQLSAAILKGDCDAELAGRYDLIGVRLGSQRATHQVTSNDEALSFQKLLSEDVA